MAWLARQARVVCTTVGPFQRYGDRLVQACAEGGTSLYTSGIDPGYGNAGLAVGALALCREVRSLRMMEIVDYATWDNPPTMFDIMGFGKPDESESLLLSGFKGMNEREDQIPAAGKVGLAEAAKRLVDLYTTRNKPEEAARWKSELEELEVNQVIDQP